MKHDLGLGNPVADPIRFFFAYEEFSVFRSQGCIFFTYREESLIIKWHDLA